METPVSENRSDLIFSNSFDARTLQRWSSPQKILVISDIIDVASLQFHAIQQARQSRAKVLLVEIEESFGSNSGARHLRGLASANTPVEPIGVVERMASDILRSGVRCEPSVVRGVSANDIPAIARSFCADRVLVSAPREPNEHEEDRAIADKIIKELNVPVCVVGRDLSTIARYQRPSRRITLLSSINSRSEIPLAFCSRLAQEIHSQLTIMYVFPQGARTQDKTEDVHAIVDSHLSPEVFKEAGFRCPIEISVRKGDPATELLNYESRVQQDFLIITPVVNGDSSGLGMRTAGQILRQAQCPVIVLADCPSYLQNHLRNGADPNTAVCTWNLSNTPAGEK